MKDAELQQALQCLFARHTFGIKLGLHVEEALIRRLGHPERSFVSIHVAGTNGKGSVCAIIESVLRCAGLRTGLYTSPHLVDFSERIAVDGKPIPETELAELIAVMDPISDAVAVETGQEPTFFEYTTALAFEHFRRRKVQVAVIETGMGGRLDATNVIAEPAISVITRVSMEHTAYLGNSIAEIAGEKAGIIKSKRPVVCGPTDPAALDVISRVARERSAPLVNVAELASVRLKSATLSGQKVSLATQSEDYGTLTSPLIGRHQVENLSTAVISLETLAIACGIALKKEVIRAGVARVCWPGRFHVLRKDPALIVDGAHNPGAAEVLADTLNMVRQGRKVGLVFGMCGDKDIRGFVRPFGESVARAWIVPIKSERNMDSALVESAVRISGWACSQASVAQALEESAKWAKSENGIVCVAGSLFLAGEVLGGAESPSKSTSCTVQGAAWS
jgi:dihydrofolate synthase / folylpolyglutamate synthase